MKEKRFCSHCGQEIKKEDVTVHITYQFNSVDCAEEFLIKHDLKGLKK